MHICMRQNLSLLLPCGITLSQFGNQKNVLLQERLPHQAYFYSHTLR